MSEGWDNTSHPEFVSQSLFEPASPQTNPLYSIITSQGWYQYPQFLLLHIPGLLMIRKHRSYNHDILMFGCRIPPVY